MGQRRRLTGAEVAPLFGQHSVHDTWSLCPWSGCPMAPPAAWQRTPRPASVCYKSGVRSGPVLPVQAAHDRGPCLPDRVIGMQIDLFILHGSPPPFDKNLVPPSPAAVQAEPAVLALHSPDELYACGQSTFCAQPSRFGERTFKTIVFHRQLPDPGVQRFHHRALVTGRRFAENASGTLGALPLPGRDPGRMDLAVLPIRRESSHRQWLPEPPSL